MVPLYAGLYQAEVFLRTVGDLYVILNRKQLHDTATNELDNTPSPSKEIFRRNVQKWNTLAYWRDFVESRESGHACFGELNSSRTKRE